MTKIRIGQGFDAHKLVEGRKLILAGVEVPFNKGLSGHSDADVTAHAIMDSVLGAAALGDIGSHFPPDDPNFKDANSMGMLEQVVEMVSAKGYKVTQVDVTIIAEAPKLAPYIQKMRENISASSGVALEAVSVKATTTEGLGFTGRGEGMAALAVTLLEQHD